MQRRRGTAPDNGNRTAAILVLIMGMTLWCILTHEIPVSPLPVRVFVTAEQVENHEGIMILSVLHKTDPCISIPTVLGYS